MKRPETDADITLLTPSPATTPDLSPVSARSACMRRVRILHGAVSPDAPCVAVCGAQPLKRGSSRESAPRSSIARARRGGGSARICAAAFVFHPLAPPTTANRPFPPPARLVICLLRDRLWMRMCVRACTRACAPIHSPRRPAAYGTGRPLRGMCACLVSRFNRKPRRGLNYKYSPCHIVRV